MLNASGTLTAVTVGPMTASVLSLGPPRLSNSRIAHLVLVTTLATVMYIPTFAVSTKKIVFPIPFCWVLGTGPLLIEIVIAHLIVFRSKLWRSAAFIKALRTYVPSVAFQISQILFCTLSLCSLRHRYRRVATGSNNRISCPQMAMKTQLKWLSMDLKDFSGEVAVCGIEITASLYQSMIMQTTPTPMAMACIIGLDLAHGLFVIKVFMDRCTRASFMSSKRKPRGRKHAIVAESSQFLPRRYNLIPLVRELLQTSKVNSVGGQAIDVADRSTENARCSSALARAMTVAQKQQTISMALETLYLAEEILLSEYFEVVVPVINCIFLAIAAQLPSAKFNPRIAPFYHDQKDPLRGSALAAATQANILYSLLQGIMLIVAHWVLKRRYGISALSYLAFILERHALSITGEMMAWCQ